LSAKMVLLMVAASVICVRAADTLDQVRRSAVQDEKVTAFSENGAKVTLEARRSWLGVTHAGGSTQGAELLVLFDRRAGSFWWGLNYLPGASSAAQTDHPKIDAVSDVSIKVYSGLGRIVVFEGVLEVRECRDHAENIDDAERQALYLARAWAAPDLDRRTPLARTVLLLAQVDDSMYMKPLAENGVAVSLQSVVRDADGWVVTIRGYWSARITLDEEYNIKHWERVAD